MRYSSSIVRYLLAAVLLASPIGCSSSTPTLADSIGGSTGSSGAGGSAGVGGGAGAGRSCPAPGYAAAAEPVRVQSVSAVVLDTSGEPVSELLAQVCGTDLCINAQTDQLGAVRVTADELITKPAFKYGDGVTHAKFAQPLASGVNELGNVTTVAFPALSLGAPLVPGASSASGAVTLTLQPGTVVEIDPFDYPELEQQTFRAAVMPALSAPAAVDETLGLELIVALAPVQTTFCPAAALAVDNQAGWAPGSAVEFFLHGVDIEEQWAPYAGWAKVSDGTVSADGARVETSLDGGIPVLSVVGVRLAP